MTEIPDDAIAAAERAAPTRRLGFSASAPLRQAVFREEIRKMLVAAAPHLLAAEVSAHRAEQDAVHADLSQLLRVLGMGDHARPQSSHEVMLDAINEVGKIRVALRKAEAIIEDRDAEIERQRVLLAERDRQWADALSENERLRNQVTTLQAEAEL